MPDCRLALRNSKEGHFKLSGQISRCSDLSFLTWIFTQLNTVVGKMDFWVCFLPLLQMVPSRMKSDVESGSTLQSGTAAIQCRDVCRSYGKLRVLNDLNLTVLQGQM